MQTEQLDLQKAFKQEKADESNAASARHNSHVAHFCLNMLET